MNKCGDCKNFSRGPCLWGYEAKRGSCKVRPFKLNRSGQVVKVEPLVSHTACKKFISKEDADK